MKGAENIDIKNAFLQLFIDDFQAEFVCSKFTVKFNGNRFTEAEKLLNTINQTGPVGKLISIPIPEDFFPLLKQSKIGLLIDETNGSGDGFAIDFVRILINRKRENTCKGNINGIVLDRNSNEPIVNATVYMADHTNVLTTSEGKFSIKEIPTGYEIVSASAPGYVDGSSGFDIGEGENDEGVIYLAKSDNIATYNNQAIKAGETINLNKILFDQGKHDLRSESVAELDKIVVFLQSNPNAEIELSGHTSSEGDASLNRSLSYKRVKACKDYIVTKSIDAARIVSIGYGPDKPIAENDSESNRAKNRRVEMRVLKL